MRMVKVLFISLLMAGCASHPVYVEPPTGFYLKGQSWDQENLKSNDKGCPTAIFVAPDGNLVQCW